MADNYVAGWAHFPVFLWIVGPILAYFIVKTEYAKYQVKQALVWQVLWSFVLAIIVVVAYLASFVNTLWSDLFVFLGYVLGTIFIAYSLFAAYKCFEGEEFSYPVVHYLIRR